MAEIAAVVIQTLQWVGAPVTRQFQYLCCFGRNITSLTKEANELEDATRNLCERVDRARNDLRVISDVVDTWLENSNVIQNETRGILDEVSNVKSGCLKLGARFFLSRRAKKTTERLKELQDRCKFQPDDISQPAPAAATQAIPSGMTYEFESRKQIEEDVMATLRGGDVNMMGICGMGGLGKTTMAVKIMNRALKEHVFEEVVMAVVSQPIDKLKIQLDIGGTLGLELTNETPQARVQKLHARLRGTKRILLVLDDVWDSLVPEDIGIPSGCKECTILLTSRNHDVLRAMDVQKIFGMEELSGEDSWIIFRGRVGTCVDNTELNSIAKEVVNECQGLPLALVTVGAALKGEVNVDKWKNAVRQLEKGDPDIPGFNAKVYNPLKLSFDVLEPKYQSVFLLCCLYPEDADIPLWHLTYFCMGLRMFEGGIRNVEEARNRMCTWTEVLKSRSLLLDSKNGDEYVRMHDVVRDVCIIIAKQKGYIGDNDCSWISSIHRSELPMGLTVPNLRLLFFQDNSFPEGIPDLSVICIKFTLDNSFLEGIRDLSVICIEEYSLVSLPHATQMLRNLNTLILDSCGRVETLSVVGELVNLEILICRSCYSIEELPPGIKGLKRLKVLDLTECENLQRIGRGILSSLVELEELKMLGSFKKWEGEDREERENAGLRELEALTKLRWLEIEIQDPALAAQNIRLSSKLDRFTIKFECETYWSWSWSWGRDFDRYLSKKKMLLNWDGAAGLGHWIEMQLLRDIECLYLSGNGANNVDFTKLEKMKMLELGFQNLKELRLYKLPALKQLWKSSQNELGKEFLPQLEVLYIWECEMMEGVFMWKEEDGNENNTCHPITIMFPKLKELFLVNLPNLISLCQGIEGIEFPLLSHIWIKECGKMKGMVANGVTSNENNSAHTHSHLFCESQQALKQLWKSSQNELGKDFLPQLEVLEIEKCEMMEGVFMWKGVDGNENNTCHPITIMFPKLKKLELVELPNLISLCQGIEGIEFPLLKKLWIIECGKMKGMVANGVTSNENNSAHTHCHLFCESQQNLKELKLYDLPALKQLWKSSQEELGKEFLPQLEVLDIRECEMMEGVFMWKGEDGNENNTCHPITIMFPKLKELWLENLPNLISLCQGIEGIEFPLLRKMVIRECVKMKGMVANENNSGDSSNNADTHYHLFCKSTKVSFGCLKILDIDRNPFCSHTIHVSLFNGLENLTISRCAGSLSLFTSSIAGNLVNLEVLSIRDSDEMVEVIKDDDEEKAMSASTALLFPKLHTLRLWDLPKLVSFCGWKCDVELPSLSELTINGRHNMKSFTSGLLTTPNLKSVKIDWDHFGGIKDVNEFLQQCHSNRIEKKQDEEAEKKKKTKGGEEEQESRAEIEEELN